MMAQVPIVGLIEFFVWLLTLILGGCLISRLIELYDSYDLWWSTPVIAAVISAEITWFILGFELVFRFQR